MQHTTPENDPPQALGLTVYDLPDPVQVAVVEAGRTWSGRLRMLLVMLVCAAPVVASYLAYYVIRPQGTPQLGQLVQDPTGLPDAVATTLDGQAMALSALKGQWLLVSVSSGQCDAVCQSNLLMQRQVRAALGREKDRTDWVWLITDDAPVSDALRQGLGDAWVLRVDPSKMSSWLQPAPGAALEDHLYLVDPQGRWMMRFPPRLTMDQAASLKREWERLLRASASWDRPGR